MTSTKSIIVLPITGVPFIVNKTYKSNDKCFHDLQTIVDGSFEVVSNHKWFINSFNENLKWLLVNNFITSLRKNQYKLYLNDEGAITKTENSNIKYYRDSSNSITYMYGRGALVVNTNKIETFLHDLKELNENPLYNNNVTLPWTGATLEKKDLEDWLCSIDEDEDEDENETDPFAEEKAYDEYKGK